MLALASFTACLHYDDVVERLQLYNKLQHLAEIYPGNLLTVFYNNSYPVFLEQYGPVLSSWSSNGNLKKSMAGEGGGDDDKSIDVDAAEMDEMVEGKFDCLVLIVPVLTSNRPTSLYHFVLLLL